MEFGRVLPFRLLVLIWVLIVVRVLGEVVTGLPPCDIPAIYNFGDSNSDTGGLSAAFYPVPPPNGKTFFRKPSGRSCDGRLLIDFMAEHLGLPYLSPYLDSIGRSFRHGANFATGGASIKPKSGYGPFSLDVQLSQFNQFKARTTDLYNRARKKADRIYLPRPKDFSKALYILDIGQNDLAVAFGNMTDAQVIASIPDMVDQFSGTVQQLYEQGARRFWIHNTGPIGCLPLSLFYFYTPKPGVVDKLGCIKSHNDVAEEFNRQLKKRVIKLRAELLHAALTYVDIYAAKYGLISDAKKQGFVDPFKICCGHYEEKYQVSCGQKEKINGTQDFGGSCGNPSSYISWDGVHYSQAANHWISNRVINGAVSDPPIPIAQACHEHIHM